MSKVLQRRGVELPVLAVKRLSNGAAEPIADRLISTTFNKLKRTVVEAMVLQSLLQTVSLVGLGSGAAEPIAARR